MKCKVKIDRKVQDELNKNIQIVSIICLIVGVIGLIAYIVLGAIIESEPFWIEFFLAFSAPFAFGLVMLVINANNKKKVEKAVIEDAFDFQEEFMMVESSKNGEVVSNLKFYYKEIIKVKETNNYLFLYPNKASAFAIPKHDLSEDELNTLKGWVKIAREKSKDVEKN